MKTLVVTRSWESRSQMYARRTFQRSPLAVKPVWSAAVSDPTAVRCISALTSVHEASEGPVIWSAEPNSQEMEASRWLSRSSRGRRTEYWHFTSWTTERTLSKHGDQRNRTPNQPLTARRFAFGPVGPTVGAIKFYRSTSMGCYATSLGHFAVGEWMQRCSASWSRCFDSFTQDDRS